MNDNKSSLLYISTRDYDEKKLYFISFFFQASSRFLIVILRVFFFIRMAVSRRGDKFI
jgi:hypothetical protein